jgi:hypothetical protein
VAREVLEARERFGQLVAGTIGTSVVDLVTRSQEVIGNSASLTAARAMSHAALGDSMITANLTAINAKSHVQELSKYLASAKVVTEGFSSELAGVQQIAELVEQQNHQLLRFDPTREIAHLASLSTSAFENVLRLTSSERTGGISARVEAAGLTTGWVLDASLRLTAPVVDTELERATETALGPAGAGSELRAQLATIDPELPTKLDGAWERIDNGGTDAGRQAAHSLMEAVDWTLRLLAPEDQVLAWYAGQDPKPEDALDAKQRPTRTLKFRYIVRDRPDKGFAIDLYRRSIGGLVGALQDPKHGSDTTDPRTLAAVAMTVEGFLLFVVYD